MSPVIRRVSWGEAAETLKTIRFKVFVEEQSVPVDEELDGMDEVSTHFLATVRDRPVGVARLMPSGQIGRMAVLISYRRHGIGALLLHAAVKEALENGFPEPFLHAQTHALGFYAQNGFSAFGEIFLDAGIEHRAMRYVGDT
ncbi:MAG: GNAT family N-acetyltransferase [Gammaproteobacteria bacterium]|nr:GNAT family N-acetyltransferase [Gammaproteobacteria bacterium]